MKTLRDGEELLFNPPELGCVFSLSELPGGGSKIYDRSPYGNIGTIVGATWVRLPSGLWCLSFDGNDDYVDCGDDKSLDITGALTIEAWANLDDVAPEQFLFCRGSGNVDGYFFSLGDGGRLHLVTNQASTRQDTYTPVGQMVAGTWYHIVTTRIGVTVRFYKNAEETPYQSQGTHIDPGTSTRTAKIGIFDNLVTGPLDGRIALHRIYNRALSLLEIQNHFNQEKQLFGVW
jgi:hypothetical protein